MKLLFMCVCGVLLPGICIRNGNSESIRKSSILFCSLELFNYIILLMSLIKCLQNNLSLMLFRKVFVNSFNFLINGNWSDIQVFCASIGDILIQVFSPIKSSI